MAGAAAPDRADVLGLQGSISTLLERVNDAVRGGTPDAAPLAECLHRLLILRDDVDALSEKKAVARQHKTGAARPPAAKGPAQRKQQRRPPSQNNARARRRAERAASPAVQARKEAHAERRDRARTMEAAARAHREYVPASPSAASSAPASMDQDLDSPSHGPGPEQAHEPSGADPSQEGGAAPAPQDAAPTARGAVCPVLPPPAIPTHFTPPDTPMPITLDDVEAIVDAALMTDFTDWDAEAIVAAARRMRATTTFG